MDIFAHAFWTNAVFYSKYKNRKRARLWAVAFGVLPDIISFAPAVLFLLFNWQRFRPAMYFQSQGWVFTYALRSYNFTHSLVIFLAAALAVAAVRKGKVYWPMLAWALHIIIDIPTHKNFFPTPFLYPLSNYHNPYAVPWAEPKFMLINYTAIVLVYLALYGFAKKPKGNLN